VGVLGTSTYRWIILLLATLVHVGVSILQQAPAALGPILTRDLELSRARVGILSSAIWGGRLLAMLPLGLMIDRHGERRLIMAGVATMALLAGRRLHDRDGPDNRRLGLPGLGDVLLGDLRRERAAGAGARNGVAAGRSGIGRENGPGPSRSAPG
jgi:MFS family permease